MLRFRRATVAVLILLTLWPTLVFGQASKAGIVTTLEGRATAARVVLPRPVPLQFKDDVFLNDEITTAEKSLARILLGGKAVVTVRERSSLTITEVPGLSTIDIASGKIAMAVARERLRPGEQIQIRTPNAITGIRGTSLIVEVIRSIADTKQPDPNAITRLGVFNGTVDVQHINPITKAPLAPPVNVAINTKFSAAGTQPAAVAPFQPGDAASFQQGVTPTGPHHVQAANETALAAQAQETANALLTALGTGAVVAAPLAPTPTSTVDTRPEINDDKSTQISCAEQPNQPSCASPIVQVPPPPRPGPVPSNITVDPSLQPFTGGANAVVEIRSGAGPLAVGGNAFDIAATPPVPANLTIPLLIVADGDLQIAGNLLNVGGALSTTTSAPVVQLSGSDVKVAGDFLRIGSPASPSATVNVAGPLVRVTNGTLLVGSPITGNVIGNGGFENGLTEWTIFNQPGGDGNFLIHQAGTASPISGFSVPAPPGGSFAAMSDQLGGGSHILYRDVVVPADAPVLRFAIFVGNRAPLFASPNSLDFTTNPNQQVRVDLVSPTANIQDVGTGVLRPLFQTQPGQSLVSGYHVFTADLSEFAGQTVRLRFSEVDNQFFFQLGVDDVVLGTLSASPASLLRLDSGRVSSTSTEALLLAIQSHVITGADTVALTNGSTLTTPGTLLGVAGGSLRPQSGTVVSLSDASELSARTILDLSDVSLLLDGPIVKMRGESTLTVTGGPAIKITRGEVRADSLLGGDDSNTIDITGTALELLNTKVTLNTLARGNETLVLRLTPGQPILRMSGTAFTTMEASPLFELGDDERVVTTTGVALIATETPPQLPPFGPGTGVVITQPPLPVPPTADSPSRLHLNGALMDLGGVILSDPNAQIQLTRTFVEQRGSQPLIESFGGPVTARGPLLVADLSALGIATNLLMFGPGTFMAENPAANGALLQFTNSTVMTEGSLILARGNAELGLARGLLDVRSTAVPSRLESRNGSLVAVVNGASLLSTVTDAPLLRFSGTDIHRTTVTTAGNLLALGVTEEAGPPAVSLRGSLLEAINTTMTNGDPTRNAFTFLFVADGSTVRTSQTDAPLLVFRGSTVDTAGNVVTLRRSALSDEIPSRIVLSGPLVLASNSRFNTTSLGLSNVESACCSGFFIGEGGELSSTSALPLITLTDGSNFNAGPDAQSGGSFFTVTDSSGGFGGQPAPSTVTVAGPWLRAASSTITAQFSLLDVSRSTMTSSSTEPLVQLEGSSVNVGGAMTRVVDGRLLASTVAALANVLDSSVVTGSHGVDVNGVNAVVELRDFIRLSNSIMTVTNGSLANVNGGRLTVTGNLVNMANGSRLNILNGLLLNMVGGTATINGALVNFAGSGNVINVSNNLVPNFFHPSGIPIFIGANTPTPVITGTPLAGMSGNTININGQPLSGSATGSLIAVQNGATLRIGSAQ